MIRQNELQRCEGHSIRLLSDSFTFSHFHLPTADQSIEALYTVNDYTVAEQSGLCWLEGNEVEEQMSLWLSSHLMTTLLPFPNLPATLTQPK